MAREPLLYQYSVPKVRVVCTDTAVTRAEDVYTAQIDKELDEDLKAIFKYLSEFGSLSEGRIVDREMIRCVTCFL